MLTVVALGSSALPERHEKPVRPDGQGWRRVVPSPQPLRIIELNIPHQLLMSTPLES